MGYKPGTHVRPIYKKLLAAALIAYVAASSYLLTDLIARVGEIEHHLEHH